MKNIASYVWAATAAVMIIVAPAAAGTDTAMTTWDGWAPKFYPGLEAVGSVECVPNGFKDMAGNRCQWNQSHLGQKNWSDLA